MTAPPATISDHAISPSGAPDSARLRRAFAVLAGPGADPDAPPRGRGVCLIAPGGAGGIQTYVRLLEEALARDETPAYRLDPRRGRAWLSPFSTLGVGWRLARLAGAGRIDVVHLMMSERMSVWRKGAVALWARALGLRVVMHHHGAELAALDRGAGPAQAWALRVATRAAHVNLALGRAPADFLRGRLGLPPERVAILRNALPDAPPTPRPPRPAERPLRVLFLAVMTRRKGACTLVDALARLADYGVPFQATLAGDGPDRIRAMRRAEAHGLSLRFPGMADAWEARRLIAWADVLVLPSTNEGLPMTVLEAMRDGLPVIVSPVGAIGDALPQGAGVRHAPPRDPRALALALERLAADPEAAAALGAAGRKAFETRFRMERHLADLRGHYGWETRGEGDLLVFPGGALAQRAAAPRRPGLARAVPGEGRLGRDPAARAAAAPQVFDASAVR